ncbi:Uncharacterised protein [uncultured archaeon]|nr:Uncharacterised protein [uncultured archaeon]
MKQTRISIVNSCSKSGTEILVAVETRVKTQQVKGQVIYI